MLIEFDSLFIISALPCPGIAAAAAVIRIFVLRGEEVDLVVADEGGEVGLLVCVVVEEVASGSGVASVGSLLGLELSGASEGSEEVSLAVHGIFFRK